MVLIEVKHGFPSAYRWRQQLRALVSLLVRHMPLLFGMLLVHVPRPTIGQRTVTECAVRDVAGPVVDAGGVACIEELGARATIRQVIGGDVHDCGTYVPVEVPVM